MRAFETFPNLVTMFFIRAAERGDTPFLWASRNGEWRAISWREAAARVASIAAALTGLGFRPGDRIALVSENRPEWCLVDLGIMAAGCVTVPTYTTNTEHDHLHVLENSGARAVFVSTQKLARTVMQAALRSTACRTVIGFEPLHIGQASDIAILDLDSLLAAHPGDVAATAAAATAMQRHDLACLIYTSGTGGAPRGVRQHHGAILKNVEGCIDIIANDFGWGDEIFLSFLPLSHAYEHSGGQFLPIGLGGQIYYAESLEKLAANITAVRPTIMVTVPRLFEMLRQRIVKTVEKDGAIPRYLLRRALELGAKDRLGLADRPIDFILEHTIRSKIRRRFGGRMKALVSGGAPLNTEVDIFFRALGLTVLQGYGQTESGPVISCGRPSAGLKAGTVGPPLKDVEVRIAEDGEILVRGELVMHGYWRNEEETARVLKDGWLHTGDIGRIDDGGRLMITDRKKDLIVNDKGDNVSPARVEGMLTLEPEIFQAMVSGDRRPYLVGLIVPDPDWMQAWADQHGVAADLTTLKSDAAFNRAVMVAVDRVNASLSVIERVRRVAIADGPFTVDEETLTPSMKIRRHVLKDRYGARLDGLYRG